MPSNKSSLAIDGGPPVRKTLLPYGRQSVDDSDIAAVTEVLQGDWLTTGPHVGKFEQAFAEATGAHHAVVLSSGTAALHAMLHVLDLQPGDEVIVPSLTFAATANAVKYVGARPVFADVDPSTLLMGCEQIAACITPQTRAVIAVDYAGQPCDYDAIAELARDCKLRVLSDACHSLGATDNGRRVGSLAELTAFSLHPVKAITSAEGGIVTTADAAMAERLRQFRNHGIATDHRLRESQGTWFYEQVELGFNYRLSDLQSSLGLSQLRRLPTFVARRRELAQQYDIALRDHAGLRPLAMRDHVEHAYHLYVVQLETAAWRVDRLAVFRALRAEGIGVQVHYIPVHLHPYYREQLGTRSGQCPAAEAAYERVLSLPIFSTMTDDDQADVLAALDKVWQHYQA